MTPRGGRLKIRPPWRIFSLGNSGLLAAGNEERPHGLHGALRLCVFVRGSSSSLCVFALLREILREHFSQKTPRRDAETPSRSLQTKRSPLRLSGLVCLPAVGECKEIIARRRQGRLVHEALPGRNRVVDKGNHIY